MNMRDVKNTIQIHNRKDAREAYGWMLKSDDLLDRTAKYIALRQELSEAKSYLARNSPQAPEHRTLLGILFRFHNGYMENDSKKIDALKGLITTLDEAFSEGLEKDADEGDFILYKDSIDGIRVVSYIDGAGYSAKSWSPLVDRVDPANILCVMYPGGSYITRPEAVPVIHEDGEVFLVGMAEPLEDKIVILDMHKPDCRHMGALDTEAAYALRTLRPVMK